MTAYLLERAWVAGAVHDDVLVEVVDGRLVTVEAGLRGQSMHFSGVATAEKCMNPRVPPSPVMFVGCGPGEWVGGGRG